MRLAAFPALAFRPPCFPALGEGLPTPPFPLSRIGENPMKRLLTGFVLSCTLAGVFSLTAPARAERPNLPGQTPNETEMIPSPPTTPEMWYYMQEMRRYDDPKQAIRRKAEIKAAQRRDRLASLKWYGYSNSRPLAAHMPFMGSYSPTWVGNSWNPFYWHTGYSPSYYFIEGESGY
jgi:hypothetical protein